MYSYNSLHNFCIASSVMHIMYFSGQCGYNTGLFAMCSHNDVITYILLTLWLTLEGPIMCLTSTLALYGMYYEKREFHILKWCFVAPFCIIVYVIFNALALALMDSKFSYYPKFGITYYYRRLDIIGYVWRIFVIVCIFLYYKLYKTFRRSSMVR